MAGSNSHILDRLNALSPDRLLGIRRGIEKESLRVRRDGSLAMTPHPAALGSALTHPSITTDFSESQIELITGVHDSAESCLRSNSYLALKNGPKLLATAQRQGAFYERSLTGACAILLGGEGPGLSAELIAAADGVVSIPMQPPVESLNVAVSAAVIIYEARRQRAQVHEQQRITVRG